MHPLVVVWHVPFILSKVMGGTFMVVGLGWLVKSTRGWVIKPALGSAHCRLAGRWHGRGYTAGGNRASLRDSSTTF